MPRRSLCALALTAFVFVLAAPAEGAPPTALKISQNGGVVSASWKLPAGTKTGWLEFAPSTASDGSGAFTDAGAQPFQIYDDSTKFKATSRLKPGTWYAHVSSISSSCDDIEIECVNQWSKTVVFTVSSSSLRFTRLEVKRTQKAKKLVVRAAISASGKITVGGTIKVPNVSKAYKLKGVSVTATAGKTITLKVKLPKKALRATKRALEKRRKVRANLTITAKDAAGNSKAEKRSVRLKR